MEKMKGGASRKKVEAAYTANLAKIQTSNCPARHAP